MSLDEKPVEPVTDEPQITAIEIQFEVNSDFTIHRRTIYSFLDFLGDVGGLYDAVTIPAEILIYWFAYPLQYIYLI